MLDFLFWRPALVSVLLGFLDWNPRAYNLGCVCRLDYVHAGLFICVHDLPKNLNPNFSDFVSRFLAWYAFILVPFYIYLCFWVSVSHVCLFVFFSRVKLWFIFFSLFLYHEHAFICSYMNAIGVGLLQDKWGKSCIHMNMHLWTWFCFDDRDKHVCLVKFFLKYRCNYMFAWIFLCLCCCLEYDMMTCIIVTC